MNDLTEIWLRNGIAFCQARIDDCIRYARRTERLQWRELCSPAIFLAGMAIQFYQLHYLAALLFYSFASALAALNHTLNSRHLRWLRETKREWAKRRAQWQSALTQHLERKERGFE